MSAWGDSEGTSRGVLAWERVRRLSLAFLVGLGEGADLVEWLGAGRRTRGCKPLESCGWDFRDGDERSVAFERVRRLVASGSSSVWLADALRLAGISTGGSVGTRRYRSRRSRTRAVTCHICDQTSSHHIVLAASLHRFLTPATRRCQIRMGITGLSSCQRAKRSYADGTPGLRDGRTRPRMV